MTFSAFVLTCLICFFFPPSAWYKSKSKILFALVDGICFCFVSVKTLLCCHPFCIPATKMTASKICGEDFGPMANLGAEDVPPIAVTVSYFGGANDKFAIGIMLTNDEDGSASHGAIHPFAWMEEATRVMKQINKGRAVGEITDPLLFNLYSYTLHRQDEWGFVTRPALVLRPYDRWEIVQGIFGVLDMSSENVVNKDTTMANMARDVGEAFAQIVRSPQFPRLYANYLHEDLAVKHELASLAHPFYAAIQDCKVKVQKVESIDFFAFQEQIQQETMNGLGLI